MFTLCQSCIQTVGLYCTQLSHHKRNIQWQRIHIHKLNPTWGSRVRIICLPYLTCLPIDKKQWPYVAYSYSVIAADTLRDLVTLSFDLLILVSGYAWRVTWSIPPPSLKILRLSVLELWVLTSPIGYHWQDRAGHLEARFQGEGVVPGEYFWFLQN